MKILCLNASDSKAEVCFIDRDNQISQFIDSPHCEKILPTISKIFEENQIGIKDIDVFAVVLGPGSFTGIRIAVATIKAMAFVNQKAKLVCVSNFDLVANLVSKEKNFMVVLNSNNEDKYVAVYKNKVCEKITSMHKQEILDYSNKEMINIFGLKDEQDDFDFEMNFLENQDNNLGNLVLEKVKNQQFNNIQELAPIYVKKSQAERERQSKMLANLVIEPVKDFEEILMVENACFENPWSEQIIKEELMQENKYYYVAKENEKVVGFIGFETDAFDMNLQKIAVIEDYRNCGIATKLLEFSLKEKDSLSKEKYFLEVDVENLPAINLYKKLGFEVISTRKRYYKNGHDCFVMQYTKK